MVSVVSDQGDAELDARGVRRRPRARSGALAVGHEDPVLTPDLLDGYAERIDDFQLELVDGVGHWIVDQRPDLVLDRVRAFLRRET